MSDKYQSNTMSGNYPSKTRTSDKHQPNAAVGCRAYVSDATVLPEVASDALHARLLQEHTQLRYTPVKVGYLDSEGCLVSQNAYSYGVLGCHGTDQHLPGWSDPDGQTLHSYMSELFQGDMVRAAGCATYFE